MPSQPAGLSEFHPRTKKEVKAANAQQTLAWVCHKGPDAIQELALTGKNRPGCEGRGLRNPQCPKEALHSWEDLVFPVTASGRG